MFLKNYVSAIDKMSEAKIYSKNKNCSDLPPPPTKKKRILALTDVIDFIAVFPIHDGNLNQIFI